MPNRQVLEMWTTTNVDDQDPNDTWKTRWALTAVPDGFTWLAGLPTSGGTQWVELEDMSAPDIEEVRAKMTALLGAWPVVKSIEVQYFNVGKGEQHA